MLPFTVFGMIACIAAALWGEWLLFEPTSAVGRFPVDLRIFTLLAALGVILWLTMLPARLLAKKLCFNKKKRILTTVLMLAYYAAELTVFFIILASSI